MIEVKFKPEYYAAIREGRKTQTMRIPPSRWDVEEGDMVRAIFKDMSKELLLTITKVGYKKFGNITDEDAEREGFTTADELKQELKEIYDDTYELFDFNRIYYYRFEVSGEIDIVR